jgi:hypothetical protein
VLHVWFDKPQRIVHNNVIRVLHVLNIHFIVCACHLVQWNRKHHIILMDTYNIIIAYYTRHVYGSRFVVLVFIVYCMYCTIILLFIAFYDNHKCIRKQSKSFLTTSRRYVISILRNSSSVVFCFDWFFFFFFLIYPTLLRNNYIILL